ncbi:hypothetical protein V8E53_007639 [Lactarius tabidus]
MSLVPDWKQRRGEVDGKGRMWFEQACSVPDSALSLASIPIPHMYAPSSSIIVSPPTSLHSHSFPPHRAILSPLTLSASQRLRWNTSPQKSYKLIEEESPPSVTRPICHARSSMAPPPLKAWQESWERYMPSSGPFPTLMGRLSMLPLQFNVSQLSRRSMMAMATMAKKSAVAIFRAVSTPHYAMFSIYPASPLSSHPSTDPPEDFQPSRTSSTSPFPTFLYARLIFLGSYFKKVILFTLSQWQTLEYGRPFSSPPQRPHAHLFHILTLSATFLLSKPSCASYTLVPLPKAGHAELVGPDLWHWLSEEVDHDIYKCRVEDDVDAYEHTRVSSTPFAHCRALLYMLCSLAGEGSALRKGPRCRYTLAQVSHRQLYTVHETWSPNEASAYDPISDSTS